MPVYRAYAIDPSGKFASVKVLNSDNDEDAIRICEALAATTAIQLWDRTRFVAHFDKAKLAA
ncbi:MAG TPA: hypothetical protein VHD34_07645 [Xanthobacteraceae bacterium]|nr:hypothetical protein [Xanthobacteraceae bacterium]